jgi:hypothetical protein
VAALLTGSAALHDEIFVFEDRRVLFSAQINSAPLKNKNLVVEGGGTCEQRGHVDLSACGDLPPRWSRAWGQRGELATSRRLGSSSTSPRVLLVVPRPGRFCRPTPQAKIPPAPIPVGRTILRRPRTSMNRGKVTGIGLGLGLQCRSHRRTPSPAQAGQGAGIFRCSNCGSARTGARSSSARRWSTSRYPESIARSSQASASEGRPSRASEQAAL